ncbi:PAS domain S-box protein [Halorubrum sp. GN11_10-6_MGM]|uniref:sensor histidine kinase n=1 Tax=Halorubrum sp. GN11_10-6_MGM TaxID=2518112 RepID=UPI0010F72FF3|nr:PAS domain S-box protein [Halorubrum sp. GN11_10-6_MGM]TKX75490.1 PAS domain S-box protein [Halorubrum sp. GN11_10-6_MGM]
MRRQEEQLVGALFDVLEAEGHGEARQRLLRAYDSTASESRDELIERLIAELVTVLNEQLDPEEGADALTDAIEFLFDRLVSVVEVAPVAIVVVDADGAVQLWNDGAERLFGWTEADALGSRLVSREAEATEPFGDSLSRLERGERLTGVETRHPHRDGSLVDIRYWAAPLRDRDGAFDGATYVATDVGERKRREQRLTVLNRVLRHNIRNDVNVVFGHLEALAAERPDDDPHVEAMERRLAGIVDLSDAARRVERLQDSEGEASRTTFDLSALVSGRVEEFEATYAEAEFTVEAPGGVEAVAHDLLPYALDNLLENAVEHSGPSPRVRAAVREAGDRALFAVADDGPGLPAHEREVLTRSNETQLTHSTGMGIWLVRWIVRASGGELGVAESDIGGTEITVTLRG